MNNTCIIEERELSVADIDIRLQRKKIKNAYIHIKPPDGRVVVSAPLRMSIKTVEAFILQKREWIIKNQNRIRAARNIRGNQYEDDKAIRSLYSEIITGRLQSRLPYWEEKTGLKCSGWSVRYMKSRWGSCNTKTGKLNFNIMLAEKNERCLEYVILHELAHTKVPNHGKDFKAILDRYMPEWKNIRRELNG